jgi:hypothetical protein
MNSADFHTVVAEMRESYAVTLEAVLKRLVETHGYSGCDHSGLVPIPIFQTQLMPAEIKELASVLSGYARLVNKILGVCSFVAPSGIVIEVSQTLVAENVILHIQTDSELSAHDRKAAEAYMTEELHLELGRVVSSCTWVESGTEKVLSASVSYSNRPFGRTRKTRERASGKKGKGVRAA